MDKYIFRNDWHMLTGSQIVKLFDQHFSNLTIQPNIDIVTRLKSLEVATLEVMENRSSSTVYRIRQTDEVYLICQPNGDIFFYDTDDYYNAEPLDVLIESFSKKGPVFKVDNIGNNRVVVEHLKEPRFQALFISNTFDSVNWIDEIPSDVSRIAKLMRKAGAFFSSYAKK